jgi:DNA-binding transcriptional regulator YiaG
MQLSCPEYTAVLRKRLGLTQARLSHLAQMANHIYMDFEKGETILSKNVRNSLMAALTGAAVKEIINLAIEGGTISLAKAYIQDKYFLTLTAPEAFNIWIKRNGLTKGKVAKMLKTSKQNLDNWSMGWVKPIKDYREGIEKLTEKLITVESWD